MLDMNLIREEPDRVREALRQRQLDPGVVDQILQLDEQRRALLVEVEELKAQRNTVSREIGKMKDAQERQEKIDAMRQVGEQIGRLDEQVGQVEGELTSRLVRLPALPLPSVPYGVDENENVVVKTVGEKPVFDFTPKTHWDLGVDLGIINFEQGTKLSGTRFYVLSGAGARLQRALISWFLDLHIRQGYQEKYTPFMVREEILYVSGELPKFIENLYHDVEDDKWMVPTAEVPLTGIHMNDFLPEERLPLRYTAYTPCFRREKMSAGRDVRGIKRGHQFDKVEMYTYCKPEDAPAELERMLKSAEETCAGLGLTYRVKELCTGDLGFHSQKTYDLEVWASGLEEWLEVSSVSTVGDYQSRRGNIKYRPADGGKAQFVYTLNGSGLGLPRTLIAVLENYQQADGTVVVPEVLQSWMGGIDVIRPESE